MAQEEKTNIRIIITGENGVVTEKNYDSAEAMAADPVLKEMGMEVEAVNGGIRVKSKGTGNQSVVIQQNSNKGNKMYIQQGPAAPPDSMGHGHMPLPPHPPHPPKSFPEEDSAMFEVHRSRKERHDSIFNRHGEYREERLKAMEERRAEMRRRMDSRRGGQGRDKQLIIIENLSGKEGENLGIRNKDFEPEDLKIIPDPDAGTLFLSFESRSNAPVQVKLTDAENRLLLDETAPLSDNHLEKTFEPDELEEGVYFLQIIQDKKVLARRITIQ